jgi:transcriptional regulator with XRE-family HTH domain
LAIKDKREQMNISQQHLADALGIDQSTVCLWETGKTMPRAKLLPKIAKILNCTVDDLLVNVDSSTPAE